MKYLNNKFYTERSNDKYIIHENKIFRETVAPKSLKTRYKAINNVKLDKNETVIELDDGSLVLVDSKKNNRNRHRHRHRHSHRHRLRRS